MVFSQCHLILLQQQQQTGRCKALFDFTAENAGELNFKSGDIIITLEWVNEEWMNGKLGEQEGMFPLSFVEIIEELPKQEKNKNPSKGITSIIRSLISV